MNSQAIEKPLPIADGDSEAFWEGLKTGKLLLQHCCECDHVQYYQQRICRQCQSENLQHRAASGRGTIHSYSVVHRAPGPAFKLDVPYAVLLIDLEEGPRMISSLVGKDFDALNFDIPVKLKTVQIADDSYLPCFELVTE
ncbi:MAG: Zn-ribbon domain-containing OB-fold protein [Cycloclasticus sp.]|mgnify:FL=1